LGSRRMLLGTGLAFLVLAALILPYLYTLWFGRASPFMILLEIVDETGALAPGRGTICAWDMTINGQQVCTSSSATISTYNGDVLRVWAFPAIVASSSYVFVKFSLTQLSMSIFMNPVDVTIRRWTSGIAAEMASPSLNMQNLNFDNWVYDPQCAEQTPSDWTLVASPGLDCGHKRVVGPAGQGYGLEIDSAQNKACTTYESAPVGVVFYQWFSRGISYANLEGWTHYNGESENNDCLVFAILASEPGRILLETWPWTDLHQMCIGYYDHNSKAGITHETGACQVFGFTGWTYVKMQVRVVGNIAYYTVAIGPGAVNGNPEYFFGFSAPVPASLRGIGVMIGDPAGGTHGGTGTFAQLAFGGI
jgi:hypothetical protein